MDDSRARRILDVGLERIAEKRPAWDRRQAYYDGHHDLPYAPEGVNAEYHTLRKQAVANWLQLVIDAPIQRLRVSGFRTARTPELDPDVPETTDGRSGPDNEVWRQFWQPNKLDSRQRIPLQHMVLHGRGLMSVWPNPSKPAQPIIRTESGRRVHLEPDPNDPWTTAWAVKTFTIPAEAPASVSAIVMPTGVPDPRSAATDVEVGIVYDPATWHRFERGGGRGRQWARVDGGPHKMGEVPIVPFDNRPDADGVPRSTIEPLIPAQDAINTIRFLTLLSMQFSGFRQRIVSGFDPVVYDKHGSPVWRTGSDGVELRDSRGNRIPETSTPGRVGVDRLLAFPGEHTKVFDLPESNLDNYIKVLGEFLQDLFAVGQTPPQYLLNRMANLSGDALSAAESTLQSLVLDLQLGGGESWEHVMRLGNRAADRPEEDEASEVIWADAEAKSFAQLVDGISKLVETPPLPAQGGLEMLPGATPQKVERWMRLRREEQQASAARDPAAALAAAAEAFRPPGPAQAPPPDPDDDVRAVPAGTETVPGLPVRAG